eukprot:6082339-Alexandrium_andersonii.AAC.1
MPRTPLRTIWHPRHRWLRHRQARLVRLRLPPSQLLPGTPGMWATTMRSPRPGGPRAATKGRLR